MGVWIPFPPLGMLLVIMKLEIFLMIDSDNGYDDDDDDE